MNQKLIEKNIIVFKFIEISASRNFIEFKLEKNLSPEEIAIYTRFNSNKQKNLVIYWSIKSFWFEIFQKSCKKKKKIWKLLCSLLFFLSFMNEIQMDVESIQ